VLPSADIPGIGMQHLWVCHGDGAKGNVSVVSLHTNQSCVVESFHICDTAIVCADTVLGVSNVTDDGRSTAGDTVWMATDNNM